MTTVRDFLNEHDIRVKEMGRMVGVTDRTVINWAEGHKPTPMSVQLLMVAVKAENISVDWWRERAANLKGVQE